MMMEWKGAWSKDIAYTTGAVVTQGGGTYVALNNIAKNGKAPPLASDAWGVLAAPPPPSINWKGTWDARTQYQINDVVTYSNSPESDSSELGSTELDSSVLASYIVVTKPPVGNKPTDRTYWEAMSSNEHFQKQAWTTVEIVNTSMSALNALFTGLSATAGFLALASGLAGLQTQITGLGGLVTTAQTTATSALTAANTAQTAANTAQTAANTAKTAADNAKTAADNAQTAADDAQTDADDAQTAADDAWQLAADTSDKLEEMIIENELQKLSWSVS